jgi:hypothetical protein
LLLSHAVRLKPAHCNCFANYGEPQCGTLRAHGNFSLVTAPRVAVLGGQLLNLLSEDIALLAYTNTMKQTTLTAKRYHNVLSTA